MKFKTNNCIGIKVGDLDKAEKFYSGVLGFTLKAKTKKMLEYDTGHLMLYVEKSEVLQPPVPSLSVTSSEEAKTFLINNGCELVSEFKEGFWFKDPFGITYDVIQQ
jgi:catechol 2,3-dioxygenase-like lactoylglutathione lyase family enzyme